MWAEHSLPAEIEKLPVKAFTNLDEALDGQMW